MAEINAHLLLCKIIILTCEVQSSKTEIETDNLHKHIMQTSEVLCPEIKMGTKILCCITKMKYLKGEVKCSRIVTEIEHLNRDTKIQHLRDDICFNKSSLKIFNHNV